MQRLDLVALSLFPASRSRLAAAAALADDIDGRLESAIACLGDPPGADPDRLRREATALLESGDRLGLTHLSRGDAGFPGPLAAISDPPLGLWVRGELPGRDSIAIVGSRAASAAALEIAAGLAASLARRGLAIVSGLARGCDAMAHRGALDGLGPTVAVFGSGLDVVYPPEHAALADEIARSGALVSEFPPGTPPLPPHFPSRNRIISGLSRAVIVVEAGEKSGSLITAGCALEQGREVMVVPGPVLSGRNRGAHALLRDGATLVESAEDVIAALYGVSAAFEAPAPPSPLARAPSDDVVLAAIDVDEGRDLDELLVRSGVPAPTLMARLTELELTGHIVRRPAGRFVRRLGKVIT